MEKNMPTENSRDIYAEAPTTRKKANFANENDFRDDLDSSEDLKRDGFAIGELSANESRMLEIRRAALMILLGYEHRNSSEIASSLGVSRAALSKVGNALAKKLGFDRFVRPSEARANSALAAERSWASGKRKAPSNETGPFLEGNL
jgi:hypothetical protein